MKPRAAQLEVAACSETGYVRDENQDRMSGTWAPLGHLYVVADGMGGHKGGAAAAELTVQGLLQHLGEARANVSVEEAIHAAFKKTNKIVYDRAHSEDPTTEGMGSTAVLVLISGRVARVAHVGDSRAYLYRQGRLKQLTIDHTLVQKMVDAGMLKPEEASDHPQASVLDRAIGNKPDVEVDISNELLLSEGEAILLCSDGLSGYVADPEIEAVLRSQATVQKIPERLVERALQKGGEDNVTVQFIQYGTRKEVAKPNPERATQQQHSPSPSIQSNQSKTRKEAPPRKAQEPDRTTRVIVPKPRWGPLQTAATFVLGAAISAAAFYAVPYQSSRAKEFSFQEAELRLSKDLEDTKAELQQIQSQRAVAEGREKELAAELEKVKKERAEQVDANKRLLATTREDLKKVRDALATTQEDLKKTRDALATTQEDKKRTEEELETARAEISSLKSKEPLELHGPPEPEGKKESGSAAGATEESNASQ